MTYDKIGLQKYSLDKDLKSLQKQIRDYEDMQERIEAMPENLVKIKSSLNITQMEQARKKKVAIPVPPGASD